MIEQLDRTKLGQVFEHTLDINLAYEESLVDDVDQDHVHTNPPVEEVQAK